MGVKRIDLYTGYRKLVEPGERARFRELIKRRSRHEPVAYLIGEKEFFSLSMKVTPAVLIPRPETEHVVEAALEVLGTLEEKSPHRVLDLGTGSGNIAIAIAVNCPELSVTAIDASEEAIDVARMNAEHHEVAHRIHFLHGDLFEPLGSPSNDYQIIVSNPPYIRPREMESLMDDVRRYEPSNALLDSKSPAGDGLGYYRLIAERAASYLVRGGAVIVEVGADQSGAVQAIFRNSGFPTLRAIEDYAGIERVVVATGIAGVY